VFIKVDVDKVPAIARRLKVMAMPTFVFLKRGHRVGGFMGASEGKLREGLESDGAVSDICSTVASACSLM